MADRSLVQPKPLRKYKPQLLIDVPFDPLPAALGAVIQKKTLAGRSKAEDSRFIYAFPESCVLYQVVGAPATVLWLERFIASGVKKVLLLSFCGSLSPQLRIGKAVVIRKAWSDEGTSKHYFPGRKVFFPSPSLNQEVKEILRHSRLSFSEATVVSTDAPYRETAAWLGRMQARRVDVVDMEATAVFALAEYRRIEAAAVMLVSDELFSGVWNERFPSALLRDSIQHYFVPFLDHLTTETKNRP